MTSLIRILILVSALAAISHNLLCTKCQSHKSSCTDNFVNCSSGFECGSTYKETTMVVNGTRTATLIRTCIATSECNFTGNIYTKVEKVKMVTSCCSANNCTPALPASLEPTQSSKPNGVVCPSCFSVNSTWCYTSDTIQCTGDENMCFLQTTKTTGTFVVSAAVRGCATKSICNLGNQSQNVEGLLIEVIFTCTSGGLSAHKVVLTPAIMCISLMKFFF